MAVTGKLIAKASFVLLTKEDNRGGGGKGMFGGSERKERHGCSQGRHTEVLPQVSVTEVDARDRMRWAQMIR